MNDKPGKKKIVVGRSMVCCLLLDPELSWEECMEDRTRTGEQTFQRDKCQLRVRKT